METEHPSHGAAPFPDRDGVLALDDRLLVLPLVFPEAAAAARRDDCEHGQSESHPPVCNWYPPVYLNISFENQTRSGGWFISDRAN